MSFDISATRPGRGGQRDYRKIALALMVVASLVLGYLISMMPGHGVSAQTVAVQTKPADFSALPATATEGDQASAELLLKSEPSTPDKEVDQKTEESNRILKEAKAEIRAKRYDEAIALLNQAREKIQQDPQSYVVMGRALEGKKDYEAARDFYNTATDKDPYLAEAYFGFATASEALGDLEAAIGGMRNFLHVQPNPDPEKLKIAQARSAIWEWESKLGRGPWGPTKGIPPGYTEEELKRRPGEGVGIKMPIPGTKNSEGRSKYEIKHQDKFQIFKP